MTGRRKIEAELADLAASIAKWAGVPEADVSAALTKVMFGERDPIRLTNLSEAWLADHLNERPREGS